MTRWLGDDRAPLFKHLHQVAFQKWPLPDALKGPLVEREAVRKFDCLPVVQRRVASLALCRAAALKPEQSERTHSRGEGECGRALARNAKRALPLC